MRRLLLGDVAWVGQAARDLGCIQLTGLDAAIDDGLVNEAILKSRKTVDLFKMAHKRKMDVIKLRTSIGDKEDESERIVVEKFMNAFIELFDEIQFPMALSIMGAHMVAEEISAVLTA